MRDIALAQAQFQALFAGSYVDVVRFVARRHDGDAEDVAAEAFCGGLAVMAPSERAHGTVLFGLGVRERV